MNRLCLTPLTLLTAALTVAAAAPSALAVRGVTDTGKFFTEEGRRRADAVIDDIYKKHKAQEVAIETLNDAPTGAEWRPFLDQKVKDSRTNGLYVLVVRKGGRVEVAADQEAARLFTNPVRTDLANRLRERMPRPGDANPKQTADAALLDMVNQIDQRYQQGGGGAAAGGATNKGGAAGGGGPARSPLG